MKFKLDTPVSHISQVGKATSSRLEKLGIFNVKDLIFYYPFRYEDFSQVQTIDNLTSGSNATIYGTIELIDNRRSWKKKTVLTEGLIRDKTGSIKVIWFNQPYLTKILKPGDDVYLAGRVQGDSHGLVQFVNPVYEKIKQSGEVIHTARLVPIYSTTEKLTQKQIRWLIKVALDSAEAVKDWLPEKLRSGLDLLPIDQALCQIHFPDDQAALGRAIKRLKFDELFLFLLQTQMVKKEIFVAKSQTVPFSEQTIQSFVKSLPFELTVDQKKAAWQIIKDLNQARPMNRLLEGDVGSGKTVVAMMAALNTALANFQTVVMAPTEILATQHFKTFNALLSNAKLKIGLLTRTQHQFGNKEFSKSKILTAIRNGQIDIIIGTHALIQQDIKFFDLALAIIDEQHRFGVEQRKILHQKGADGNLTPHFLSMTATPIPRSLALTLYGDLDLSIIKQMPKDRKPVKTKIVNPVERKSCYDFVRQQIKSGRQAFVICPLIDPSDRLGVKSVTEEFEKLKTEVFPNLKISMLHGKLKPADKQDVMSKFLAKQSDILVSTSVIEVGVDIPNASVMLIEGAERFGLAQLHQFRGRVGRDQFQSYCFLLTENFNQKTKDRLNALVESNDGFELAEKDLVFRGPGEFFGVSQSGWPEFRIASLFDHDLIVLARKEAQTIINSDPDLRSHLLLRAKVEQLNKKVHLE